MSSLMRNQMIFSDEALVACLAFKWLYIAQITVTSVKLRTKQNWRRPYEIMVSIRGRYVIWAFPFLRCEFERVEVIQLDEQIAWGKRHIDAWLLGYLDF